MNNMKGGINKMEDPYTKKFDELVAGTIKELRIEKNEFMAYRLSWEKHPQKKHLIGEASFHGIVIYHYFEEVPII
jgi:hypothetical protein